MAALPDSAASDALASPNISVRHIVAPVDVARPNAAATQAAVDLARRWGARVSFLHMLAPVTGDPEIVAHWGDFPQQRRAGALKELEAWRRDHSSGVTSAAELREGRPFEGIVRYAEEADADLIVLAREDTPGLVRQILGSTAERVVRHAPCPVLVLPTNGWMLEEAQGPLLVSTDFSPAAAAACPWVRALSILLCRPVLASYVDEPMGLPGTREYAWHQEQIDLLRQEADQLLSQWRDQQFSPEEDVKTRVMEGTPHRAICRLAETARAPLIVMASHGSTGWLATLIGHTTERVIRHAPCAVLVARGAGLQKRD
jgi:nucleotide-binding universal stress UspA family protein